MRHVSATAALPLPDYTEEYLARLLRILQGSDEEMTGSELMFECRGVFPEAGCVTGYGRSSGMIMYYREGLAVKSEEIYASTTLGAEQVRNIIALGVTDDENWRVYNRGPRHPSEADMCRVLESILSKALEQ